MIALLVHYSSQTHIWGMAISRRKVLVFNQYLRLKQSSALASTEGSLAVDGYPLVNFVDTPLNKGNYPISRVSVVSRRI